MREQEKKLSDQRNYCSQPYVLEWIVRLQSEPIIFDWLPMLCTIADFGFLAWPLSSSAHFSTFLRSRWPPSPLWHPYDFHSNFSYYITCLSSFRHPRLNDFRVYSPSKQIGSTTLVANIFFAYFWLGEDLGRSDVIGTSLVIIGSVLSVAFGNHEDKQYTMADIRAFYGFSAFIAFIVILFLVLIGAYIGVRRLEPIRDELLSRNADLVEAKDMDDVTRVEEIERSIDEKKEAYAPFEKVHPLLYCALSGLFGGQSVLMAKTVAILLRATIEGENQFTLGLTYVFLFAMVFTIVVQTHYLATALKYFDALYVVPVFQCFWITGSTAGGAIFYQELKDFNVLQSIMFPLGIVVTLCGVLAMSVRDMGSKRGRQQTRVAPLDSPPTPTVDAPLSTSTISSPR